MGNLILSSPDIMKLITETIQCGTNKLNAVLLATSSADPFYFKNFILTNINTPNFGAFLDGRIKINSVAGVEAIATAKAEILKCNAYNDFTSSICSTSPSMSIKNGYIFQALGNDMSFEKLLERKTFQSNIDAAKKEAELAEAVPAEAKAAEAEPAAKAAEAEITRIKWDPEDYQQPSHLEFMWSRCGKGANLLWNSCGKTGRAAGRAAANFSKQCGKGAENMFNRCGKEAESMWKRCGKSLEKCDPTKKYGIAAALCFLTAYSMC